MKTNRFGIPPGPTVAEAQHLLEQHRDKAWVILTQAYGKNFLYQGNLVTCDPRLVEALLMDRMHTQRRSSIYRYASWMIPIAPGLLFMDGDAWEKRLRAVMPVFTKANVDSYAECMHQQIGQHIAHWQENLSFEDLYALLVNLNSSLFLKVGCGLDPDQAGARQLGRTLIDFKFHYMDTRSRLDDFGMGKRQLVRLPRFLKAQWQRIRKKRQLYTQIDSLMSQPQRGDSRGLNWLNRMREAGFSAPEIANEVNHLYGAYNALDYVLTGALYELGKRPALAETLRNELRTVTSERGYPTRDDFRLLPNTLQFMKEIMRVYPVTMAVARRFGESMTVDGITIPKGQEALILLHALHHHPDFWENPDQFEPRRWQAEPSVPYTYVPFLNGPRKCIGQHLAELNFVIVLNAFLQTYSVEIFDPNIRLATFMMPRFERKVAGILHRRKEENPTYRDMD
ncbi:cytochrome P450 [Spirosoma aerolatum]|uniref:cytochrome P450 n=1 Tax=Spirosoma aerolatum TaxID=1211326 RepID=UPI0009AEE635|nr:cytochrome P450 [Spirosoma aerolatum]